MNRARRLFLSLLGAFGLAAAVSVRKPVQRYGPWACVHSKGVRPCNEVAFYALVEHKHGDAMRVDNFRLLDGSMPIKGSKFVCGACGANLYGETEWPLTTRKL